MEVNQMTTPCVGISTASNYSRMPVEDFLVDLKQNGVTDAELFLNTFSEYTPEFFDLLKERVDSTGIRIHSIHPMSPQFEPQLFSGHPRQRADAMKIFEAVLEGGKLLGAERYVMHGSLDLHGQLQKYGSGRYVPVLSELCDVAASHGVQLTLENVSWCVFSTPDVGETLIREVGDKLLYTLDVKQCYRSGRDADAYLDVIGPRIVNVHLCDYLRCDVPGGYKWKLPGEGEFDFTGFFRKMKGFGYQGPFILEVYSNVYNDLPDLYACYRNLKDMVGRVWSES